MSPSQAAEHRFLIDVCVPMGWDREKKRDDEMARQRREKQPVPLPA
jgi:hypothetical protein